MSRLLRCLSLSIVLAVAFADGNRARACELCRVSGSTAFHRHTIGGDNPEDMVVPPIAPAGEEDHPGTVSAQFVPQGGTFPQPGGLGQPVHITYSYNNFLDGGLQDINQVSLPVSLIRRSVEEALLVWARHAPLHFKEVPDQGGGVFQTNYPDGQFGEIRFSHLFMNGPDIPGQPPRPKAMARFYNAGGNIKSDIFFDNGDPWQEAGTLSQPDILGAAIHELGHTLGLGHTGDSSANMYWIFHRFSSLGTGQLFPDDIAGIHSLYGAGIGSVTPLPEPATLMMEAVIAMWCVLRVRRR